MPLAPFCVLLGSGFLASCSIVENEILLPVHDALVSIKDTVEPPPPRRRVAKVTPAPPAAPRPEPRAQAPAPDPNRCHDVPSCETLLRKMTEGADRSWIARSETPQGLLTGVRMFAYRTLRPKLTCAELGTALEQLRGVPAALRPPPAGSSPEDIARTTRLAAEVADELRAENEARCRAAAAPPARPPAPPPAPAQPSTSTQPPSQPTITIQPPAQPAPAQPPAQPAPAQPQPQVIIPGQPQQGQGQKQ
jgi:hypothetical protein